MARIEHVFGTVRNQTRRVPIPGLVKRNKPEPADGRLSADTGGGALSAGGRVKRWVIGKPKLAADVEEMTGEPVEKLNVPAIAVRLITLCLTVVLVVGFSIWFMLSVTIMPTMLAGDSAWLVKRIAWTQGQAPTGETAFVLPTPVERDPLSRLEMLLPTDTGNQVVTIIAKPGDSVQQDPTGMFVVNGLSTGIYGTAAGKYTGVDNTYLVSCQTGNCIPGTVFEVPVENVLGKAGWNTTVPFMGASALAIATAY